MTVNPTYIATSVAAPRQKVSDIIAKGLTSMFEGSTSMLSIAKKNLAKFRNYASLARYRKGKPLF